MLSGAYLLRVWMVGSYMQHVRERAFSTPTSKPSGIVAQAAAVGRLLAWKIMLSAGALTTLPTIAGASWFYSACQFASLEAQEDAAERHSFTGCLALASQWFGGGCASLPDALSSLDRSVAEWPDPGDDCPAASALDFWGEYTPVYPNGNLRAGRKVPRSGFRCSRARGWRLIPLSNVRSLLFISICGRGAKETTCADYSRVCPTRSKRRRR